MQPKGIFTEYCSDTAAKANNFEVHVFFYLKTKKFKLAISLKYPLVSYKTIKNHVSCLGEFDIINQIAILYFSFKFKNVCVSLCKNDDQACKYFFKNMKYKMTFNE